MRFLPKMENYNISALKILVVGDAMLDRYVQGQVERISPEAPVPVLKRQKEFYRLGGAANAALNVKKLGAQVTFVTIVGNDNYHAELKKMLREEGVNHLPVICNLMKTNTKIRVLADNQQLLRIDNDLTPSKSATQEVLHKVKTIINEYDLVLLSDYNKGTLTYAKEIIACCNEHNVKVVVDPKKDFSHYCGATVLKPNLKEFMAYANHKEGTNIDRFLTEQLNKYNLQKILVTKGSEGMVMQVRGQDPISVNTHKQEVFDVTGAGDTVSACVAIGEALNMPEIEYLTLAKIAASIVISKVGTAYTTIEEIYSKINGKTIQQDVSLATAKHIVSTAKLSGKKIVLANGCFDIIHYGHIRFLRAAKAQGDFLVVALNDDQSIRQLKGDKRPINNQKVRSEVLMALESVDLVVCFSEPTPLKVVEVLLPEILVKGSEKYKNVDLVPNSEGAQVIKNNNGKIVLIDRVENISSTKILAHSTINA